MPREYKLKLVLGGSQNSGKTTFINSNRNNNSPIGVSFGTPGLVRPVVKLWPTLVPREAVKVTSQTMEVK